MAAAWIPGFTWLFGQAQAQAMEQQDQQQQREQQEKQQEMKPKPVIFEIKKRRTHKNLINKKKIKNTKKHVQFNVEPIKKRNATRRKDRKSTPNAQLRIKNRTATPMPMSSVL